MIRKVIFSSIIFYFCVYSSEVTSKKFTSCRAFFTTFYKKNKMQYVEFNRTADLKKILNSKQLVSCPLNNDLSFLKSEFENFMVGDDDLDKGFLEIAVYVSKKISFFKKTEYLLHQAFKYARVILEQINEEKQKISAKLDQKKSDLITSGILVKNMPKELSKELLALSNQNNFIDGYIEHWIFSYNQLIKVSNYSRTNAQKNVPFVAIISILFKFVVLRDMACNIAFNDHSSLFSYAGSSSYNMLREKLNDDINYKGFFGPILDFKIDKYLPLNLINLNQFYDMAGTKDSEYEFCAFIPFISYDGLFGLNTYLAFSSFIGPFKKGFWIFGFPEHKPVVHANSFKSSADFVAHDGLHLGLLLHKNNISDSDKMQMYKQLIAETMPVYLDILAHFKNSDDELKNKYRCFMNVLFVLFHEIRIQDLNFKFLNDRHFMINALRENVIKEEKNIKVMHIKDYLFNTMDVYNGLKGYIPVLDEVKDSAEKIQNMLEDSDTDANVDISILAISSIVYFNKTVAQVFINVLMEFIYCIQQKNQTTAFLERLCPPNNYL